MAQENGGMDQSSVCQKAIAISRQGELLHWELAILLTMIQAQELWREVGANSFKQFLQDHLRMPESTARQLIKVQRMCDEHEIPRDKVEELGWSKLAEVAAKVTAENKESVLEDVSKNSLADLRKKYRPATGKEAPAKVTSKVVWSEEIEEALRHAARFTNSNELQTNLEFIAKKFKTLMPLAPDRDLRFSLN